MLAHIILFLGFKEKIPVVEKYLAIKIEQQNLTFKKFFVRNITFQNVYSELTGDLEFSKHSSDSYSSGSEEEIEPVRQVDSRGKSAHRQKTITAAEDYNKPTGIPDRGAWLMFLFSRPKVCNFRPPRSKSSFS